MSVASHTDRHVHSYSTLSSDNVPKKRRDSPTVHVLPFAPDVAIDLCCFVQGSEFTCCCHDLSGVGIREECRDEI